MPMLLPEIIARIVYDVLDASTGSKKSNVFIVLALLAVSAIIAVIICAVYNAV